jgi:hypothetical protein
VFFPVVLWAALLGRRVGRARAGSIVDDHDVRRIFSLVACAIALGAPIVAYAGERSPRFSVDTSRALGAVATLVLFAFVIFDLFSFIRVRRAMFDVVDMRQTDPRTIVVEDVIDMGLGDDAYEKVAGTGSRTAHHACCAPSSAASLAVDAARRLAQRDHGHRRIVASYAQLAPVASCRRAWSPPMRAGGTPRRQDAERGGKQRVWLRGRQVEPLSLGASASRRYSGKRGRLHGVAP